MDHHLNDFHAKTQIQENYDYFDRNYDCKLNGCCYNKVRHFINHRGARHANEMCNSQITSHYHCLLCKFSFSLPSEMSEHICEENIEENYESFDVIENDIMKARPQSAATSSHRFAEQSFPPRDDRMLEKFHEKFFNHESKVALNSDVDLIKTTKIPFVKQEAVEDDKVSG